MLRFIIILLFTTIISISLIGQIQKPQSISKTSEIDLKTYTGIISEQYANGSPSLWKSVKNGKADGLWLEWYPNGTLRYRAYWKNSLGNGKWEYFWPNGQLRSESFYINDIAQGLYKSFHQNGQLKTDLVYFNGKKDGVEYTYDVNGMLVSRKYYENGVQVIDEPLIFEKDNISIENGNEWGIDFMPDGQTAYFTRRDLGTGKKRIYRSSKTKTGWSRPTITEFSTGEDEGAFINFDGTKLYFASFRPLPDGSTTAKYDMNIWVTTKVGDEWSDPKPLSSMINKSMQEGNVWPNKYEAGPMTDEKGNLYYWTKGANDDVSNLYFSQLKSDGSYSEPRELFPPSSTTNFDTSPYLSQDGNILFFASDDRIDGYGGGDIYYSKRLENGWSTPKNLGPVVNSYRSEGSPSISPDGKYFFFSSDRGEAVDEDGEYIWNIYYLETKFLLID